MSDRNAYSFDDLDPEHQKQLLDYIDKTFSEISSFNHKHTAYGLKQPFTRLHPNTKNHVTSKCFMEAMIKSGYKAKLVSQETDIDKQNWYFNAKIIKN